ncbi:hypothetical protein MMC25_007206 [Agyrium rufum]|nr:hypothetical protein [Agyrium rufum]
MISTLYHQVDSIEGLLRRELHPFVTLGDVSEGSYVELTRYEVKRAPAANKVGYVIYLMIQDFFAFDEDSGREPHDLVFEEAFRKGHNIEETHKPITSEEVHRTFEHPRSSRQSTPICRPVSASRLLDKEESPSIRESTGLKPTRVLSPAASFETTLKRKRESELSPLKERQANTNPRLVRNPRTDEGPQRRTTKGGTKVRIISATKDVPTKPHVLEIQTATPLPSVLSTPQPLLPIVRPLRLTPLASVVGSKASRNKLVDILAVITYVSRETFQRPGAPEGRNLRIMDNSTSKRVLVSVFTDPRGFLPKEGDVALFRSLATHDFDGGSLKAWPSNCEGRQWFVKDPEPGKVNGADLQTFRELWKWFLTEFPEEKARTQGWQ